MKISIKTIRQETYNIEVDIELTVQDLKEKLEAASNKKLPANRMSLIFSGKILQDDKPLGYYNLVEDKFLVAIIRPPTADPPETSKKTSDTEITTLETTGTTCTENVPPLSGNNPVERVSTPTEFEHIETIEIDLEPMTIEDVINIADNFHRENRTLETLESIRATNTASVRQSSGNNPVESNSAETVSTPSDEFERFHISESLVDPAAIENAINIIVEGMGFNRDQVQNAFNISYNNPDRAAEYLIGGIPESVAQNPVMNTSNLPASNENLEQTIASISSTSLRRALSATEFRRPTLAAEIRRQNLSQTTNAPLTSRHHDTIPANVSPSVEQQQNNLPVGPRQSLRSGPPLVQTQQSNVCLERPVPRRLSPLEFLRSNPRFGQMRQLLQANPDLIEPVISQIGETNPGLLELIRNNQEDFIQLINEPINRNNTDGNNNNNNNFNQTNNNATPEENLQINIAPDEWLAINRLRELGFSEAECIEAYYVCDKNEELAANFLFSRY